MITKKRIVQISFVFIIAIFAANVSVGSVFAAMPASATKGEKALRETINAEASRAAELKVSIDSSHGLHRTLRRESTGNDVKLLQQFLKTYGVYPEGLITGYFGPMTERAVKKFQKKEAIDTVGIAGPKTLARIKEISAKVIKQKPATTVNPGVADVVIASDIAEDGSAATSIISFASTTQNIYAVLSLKNAPQDTKIAYIRYYNGVYVDSKISHPSRSGLKYFHFQWSLTPGSKRAVGNYSLMFYINDKSSKTIKYTIY